MEQRTWLITGVSSGFGKELAKQLLTQGEIVVGTVRRLDTVLDLTEHYPDTFHADVLDVTDTPAVRTVVDRWFERLGHIDVIISNAGYGLFGAAEELTDAQVADLMPVYDNTPAHAFLQMLDPRNGLAPGDPARMAARIIESVDAEPAPLRIVLGSQALDSTLDALRKRIAGLEAQKQLAASTDYPPGE